MRHKTKRTLMHRMKQLSRSMKTSYLELGEHLHELHEREWWRPHASFRACVKAEFGLEYRKAAALVAMATKVRELNLDRELVSATGWSKLMMINPMLSGEHAGAWLQFAHDNSTATLTKAVRGEVSPGDSRRHGRMFNLTDAENAALLEELAHYGLLRNNRGYRNKEAALMSLVATAKSARSRKIKMAA